MHEHGSGALPLATDIASLLIAALSIAFIGWVMVQMTSRLSK